MSGGQIRRPQPGEKECMQCRILGALPSAMRCVVRFGGGGGFGEGLDESLGFLLWRRGWKGFLFFPFQPFHSFSF